MTKDVLRPDEAEITWTPTEAYGRKLRQFSERISNKYDLKIDNFWDLHQWSVDNVSDFWKEVWEYYGVIYSKPYEKVLNTETQMADKPEWFVGARLNYAENLLKHRDDKVALILAGVDRETKRMTFKELYSEACRYGAVFKKLGLQEGDIVLSYLSNREEAVLAMLGTVSNGGIFGGSTPLLGSQAFLDLYKVASPKFLFAVDNYKQNGSGENYLEKVKTIAENCLSLEKVIIVPTTKYSCLNTDISGIRNSCWLEDFLNLASTKDQIAPELEFLPMSFNQPIFINQTSGTTGVPKSLLHGSGILLLNTVNFGLHLDHTHGTVMLSTDTVGWTLWHMSMAQLFLGVTVLLYDGMTHSETPTQMWNLVDSMQINTMFLTPTTLDLLEKDDCVPTRKHHLTSLKTILSGSCSVKVTVFDFVHKKVKTDVQFGLAYGSTEFFGPYTLPGPIAIRAGEITTPSLGVCVKCFNEKGESIFGEIGELVVTEPVPSMPVSIVGDDDGSIYKQTYFSQYSDVYASKDLGKINPKTKGIIVYGRKENLMNPKGTLFNPTEIYEIVENLPGIQDSLCVSQNRKKDGKERVILFLKMSNKRHTKKDSTFPIRMSIHSKLSALHVPQLLIQAPDIPINMNGKKMESLVKRILNCEPHNIGNVNNPDCLKFYYNFAEQNRF